jgi:hypothetical protein
MEGKLTMNTAAVIAFTSILCTIFLGLIHALNLSAMVTKLYKLDNELWLKVGGPTNFFLKTPYGITHRDLLDPDRKMDAQNKLRLASKMNPNKKLAELFNRYFIFNKILNTGMALGIIVTLLVMVVEVLRGHS